VRGWSRWVWVGGSLAAAGVSARAAVRLVPGDVAGLARVMLLPLLAFVALNPVLSPQYLVWLMGPAALALLRGRVGVPVAVFAAVLLTRLVYTTDTYKVGYAPLHLLLLNARNFLLLGATLALMWELWSPRPPPEQAGAEH
jgi:hypothetical protein